MLSLFVLALLREHHGQVVAGRREGGCWLGREAVAGQGGVFS